MNKNELIELAEKSGFVSQNSPGCPTWFFDILQNQNIMLYLLSKTK